jgi:hypothetical protein
MAIITAMKHNIIFNDAIIYSNSEGKILQVLCSKNKATL